MKEVIPGTSDVVELRLADAYAGPDDCRSKQRVNSNALWYRINGGDWRRCRFKSHFEAVRWIEVCDGAEEVDAILGREEATP